MLRIRRVLPLVLLVFLAIGCTTPQGGPFPQPALPTTTGASSTATVPPLASPSLNRPPSPTLPITPSLGPLPTLTEDELQVRVLELAQNNGGCELPCIWRITPGKTPWEEAKLFLHGMGVRTSDKASEAGSVYHGTGGLDQVERGINITLGLREWGGMLHDILLTVHGPEPFRTDWDWYMMGPVLSRLGPPTEISFLAEPPREIGADTFYGIALIYEDLGLSIFYSGSTDNRPVYEICPGTSVWEVHMDIRSRAYSTPTPEVTATATEEPRGYALPLPIQEVTGLSLEEFVVQFAGEDNPACFTTPREIWE